MEFKGRRWRKPSHSPLWPGSAVQTLIQRHGKPFSYTAINLWISEKVLDNCKNTHFTCNIYFTSSIWAACRHLNLQLTSWLLTLVCSRIKQVVGDGGFLFFLHFDWAVTVAESCLFFLRNVIIFFDSGEACWWTVHPSSRQRSEGEKVRVGDDLILVSVASERYLVSRGIKERHIP